MTRDSQHNVSPRFQVAQSSNKIPRKKSKTQSFSHVLKKKAVLFRRKAMQLIEETFDRLSFVLPESVTKIVDFLKTFRKRTIEPIEMAIDKKLLSEDEDFQNVIQEDIRNAASEKGKMKNFSQPLKDEVKTNLEVPDKKRYQLVSFFEYLQKRARVNKINVILIDLNCLLVNVKKDYSISDFFKNKKRKLHTAFALTLHKLQTYFNVKKNRLMFVAFTTLPEKAEYVKKDEEEPTEYDIEGLVYDYVRENMSMIHVQQILFYRGSDFSKISNIYYVQAAKLNLVRLVVSNSMYNVLCVVTSRVGGRPSDHILWKRLGIPPLVFDGSRFHLPKVYVLRDDDEK